MLRWGHASGGGPTFPLKHKPLLAQYHPVNHPFGVGEMVEAFLQQYLSLRLDQPVANGVANQARRLVEIEFPH